MGTIILGSVIITVGLTVTFIWVTNKAYSRKWENDHDETRGEF